MCLSYLTASSKILIDVEAETSNQVFKKEDTDHTENIKRRKLVYSEGLQGYKYNITLRSSEKERYALCESMHYRIGDESTKHDVSDGGCKEEELHALLGFVDVRHHQIL